MIPGMIYIGTISQMGQQWLFLAEDYIEAVEMAGGTPVILPVCTCADTVLELAERMDGILISGGNDIDPRYYGSRIQTPLS